MLNVSGCLLMWVVAIWNYCTVYIFKPQTTVNHQQVPFILSPSPGVCWGTSVHALLCHQTADGKRTNRRNYRRSPLFPQWGQAHQTADWLQNTGQYTCWSYLLSVLSSELFDVLLSFNYMGSHHWLNWSWVGYPGTSPMVNITIQHCLWLEGKLDLAMNQPTSVQHDLSKQNSCPFYCLSEYWIIAKNRMNRQSFKIYGAAANTQGVKLLIGTELSDMVLFGCRVPH